MRNPKKLRVYSEAEELVVELYAATARFPTAERFGLTAQMRRAAVSIGSNIAEGCHRQGSRAFSAFLYNALGSAAEIEFQIQVSRRLGCGDLDELASLATRVTGCKKMISRLIVSLREDDEP
jgi:four helix bundle protein